MKRELRYLTLQDVEIRSEDNKKTLRGYAAVYNSPSKDLGFIEVLAPGAFSDTVNQDVRALINHDSNLVLGRTKSGTLRLEDDEIGLRFEVDLPDTQYARDLAVSIERGDVNQCSFGFSVKKGGDNFSRTSDGQALRTITKVDRLYDVSAVTYPAYEATTVSLRSLIQERGLTDEESQALGELLNEDGALAGTETPSPQAPAGLPTEHLYRLLDIAERS
jgi:uncharacterized protein